MDNSLQTKPLIPEWVKKLAEALDNKYLITYVGIFPEDESVTMDELVEFLWREYQKATHE
jgi:hypothetical protein